MNLILLRTIVPLLTFIGLTLHTGAQVQDSLFPPARTLAPDPTIHSPFKSIVLLHPVAIGHKTSGIVDIAFTVGNQSTQIAALIFSTNPSLSKASDDLDSLHTISQVRLGTTKRDSDIPITVELHPDQTLHCGIYVSDVSLGAQYIRQLVLLTSLTLDDVSSGEDNIIFTNIRIDWK